MIIRFPFPPLFSLSGSTFPPESPRPCLILKKTYKKTQKDYDFSIICYVLPPQEALVEMLPLKNTTKKRRLFFFVYCQMIFMDLFTSSSSKYLLSSFYNAGSFSR